MICRRDSITISIEHMSYVKEFLIDFSIYDKKIFSNKLFFYKTSTYFIKNCNFLNFYMKDLFIKFKIFQVCAINKREIRRDNRENRELYSVND